MIRLQYYICSTKLSEFSVVYYKDPVKLILESLYVIVPHNEKPKAPANNKQLAEILK